MSRSLGALAQRVLHALGHDQRDRLEVAKVNPVSKSPYRTPPGLDLEILESAFVGSDFFPVRTLRDDTIHVTKDGVLYASVRIEGNTIHINPVGTSKQAIARAKRVTKAIKDHDRMVKTLSQERDR